MCLDFYGAVMTMFTQIIKLTSKEIKTIKQYLKPNHATITWFFFIQKKAPKIRGFLTALNRAASFWLVFPRLYWLGHCLIKYATSIFYFSRNTFGSSPVTIKAPKIRGSLTAVNRAASFWLVFPRLHCLGHCSLKYATGIFYFSRNTCGSSPVTIKAPIPRGFSTAVNRAWTCTLSNRILSPARLPIPP